jgi:hypothetical protein
MIGKWFQAIDKLKKERPLSLLEGVAKVIGCGSVPPLRNEM